MNGILLVDKPSGMTSHDVVNRVRKAAGTRRVGHTGTLDPSATGLLILCIGNATRLSEFLIALDKVYEGTMLFGVVTDSYDMDGEIQERRDVPELTAGQVQQTFDRFVGDILQVPPMVSAVKVKGQPLYKRARKGEVVEREPRPVTVREFQLLSLDTPRASFRLRCTRGTYARTLCFDVGEILGCGATLESLRRTRVGEHSVDEAVALDSLQTVEDVQRRLLASERALDLPTVLVRRSSQRLVAQGATLRIHDLTGPCNVSEGWVQVKDESGRLLAMAQAQLAETGLRIIPKRVLGA